MAFDVKDFTYQMQTTKGDATAIFQASDIDEQNASPRYYGNIDNEGRYIIIKITNTSGLQTVRYTYGRSGYTTAWTNRANLSYDYWDVLRSSLN